MISQIIKHIKQAMLLPLCIGYCTVALAADPTDGNNITVSGTVTDAATGQPIAGVRVEAFGNNRYTAMTDDQGHYQLSMPRHITSVSMMVEGYNLQQKAIGKNLEAIDGKLYPATFRADYSRTAEASRKVTASDFDKTAEVSIDNLLSQRLGGDIRSISRGGNPGTGNAMFIAGLNSLESNAQPLIVLDGVIMDMQYGRKMLHQGYYNNLLANINVNDIENVTVLKNGTAIYGAKGANGVILINTKRNKSMATRIDVNINGSYKFLPKLPEMMGAEDYRLLASEMLYNQTTDISRLNFLVNDPDYYYYKMYHNNTDWTKEIYHETFVQNYGINVQGGDNVANYNLSVGYSQSDSQIRNNDYSRFDMRLNSDINVLRNLSVRFDAAYSDVNRNLLDDGMPDNISSALVTSASQLALIKAPFLSPYAYDTDGNLSQFLSQADDYLAKVPNLNQNGNPRAGTSLINPKSLLEYGKGDTRNHFGNRLVTLSITPRYNFNRHLSLSEHFNFTLVNTNENYYLPINGTPRFKDLSVSETDYFKNKLGSMASRQTNIQSDTRLTWNNRYGAHSINVMGGARYLSHNFTLNKQQGFNSGNDKIPVMSSSLTMKSTDGADDKVREVTWYGQADYNYGSKYYVMAGVSAQASSRFGDKADGLKMFNTVWGLFPSVQAAWVLTNEKWLAGIPGLDYLRLSAGFDMTGNDDIDFTASRTYFIAQQMLNAQVSGKVIGNIGNDMLKWETTRRLTAGLDGNFFNNRLNLRLNYFKSWTSDLITLQQLSWTSGLQENWGNGGKLENEGFDIQATAKVLNLKDWQWEAGFSVGHYKNKVTALPNDNKPVENTLYGGTVLTRVGGPIGLFYGYRTNGVIASEAEANAEGLYQVNGSGQKEYFQAGDMRFVSTDGDNCIGKEDRVVIGDPNPDIYGNIFTSLQWKNLRLDATFNYSLGNDIYNYQRSILEGGNMFYNQTTAMANRWTTDGQQTDIPRANYQDPMGNSRFSDRWIEDGSYLKLKNVTLSYALPISSTYLQGITVWASAENLFTVTKYLGSDPDCITAGSQLLQGIDTGLLGNARAVSLGVKINL